MKINEKGQSLVELAVSITFLIILVAGVVDLGHAFFVYMGMRDAAQEGVVYGAMFPNQCEQIIKRIKDTSPDPNFDFDVFINGVSCVNIDGTYASIPTADGCSGKEIKAAVKDTHFPITMPFLGTFLGGQEITLNAEVTGSVLRPPCP